MRAFYFTESVIQFLQVKISYITFIYNSGNNLINSICRYSIRFITYAWSGQVRIDCNLVSDIKFDRTVCLYLLFTKYNIVVIYC